ncbi:hypothetical protein AB0C34_17960 [Nocardia sp. NPDC049220]|uniref:hypothetical protein n=1 Tax=Nocardia sp. NPDC049220 TaxID=3155273 RepID=UPI0033CAFA23
MMEPAWRIHAREAFSAAVEGNHFVAGAYAAGLSSGAHMIQASIYWIDTLLSLLPAPQHHPFVPEVATGMAPAQLWALRLISARADNDMQAAKSLFTAAATREGDYLIECLMSLLALVGMLLGGQPVNEPAR